MKGYVKHQILRRVKIDSQSGQIRSEKVDISVEMLKFTFLRKCRFWCHNTSKTVHELHSTLLLVDFEGSCWAVQKFITYPIQIFQWPKNLLE